jgi:hypothetical protein
MAGFKMTAPLKRVIGTGACKKPFTTNISPNDICGAEPRPLTVSFIKY